MSNDVIVQSYKKIELFIRISAGIAYWVYNPAKTAFNALLILLKNVLVLWRSSTSLVRHHAVSLGTFKREKEYNT